MEFWLGVVSDEWGLVGVVLSHPSAKDAEGWGTQLSQGILVRVLNRIDEGHC